MVVRETWSTRTAFMLAAIGAAVGLGNIWKFPYMTGTNGGGAFVVLYLVAALAIAIPILIAEIMIGRRGGGSPPQSMLNLASATGRSQHWSVVGWLGALSGFLILSFYSVIAGWAMSYVLKTATGALTSVSTASAGATFDELLADFTAVAAWHGLFLIMTVYIVARGLHRGIEGAVLVLMPALFVMLLILVIYSAVAGDFATGVDFLFNADFSKLSGKVVLMAIGQAFFSIGVSMGIMMTYGAYLRPEVSIGRSAFVIAGADTLVALLAGMAIFPLVFANGLDPAEGPGLIFVTLPIAFANMPAGALFGTVFFVLLTFAALTSAISILEPLVSWLTERPRLNRITATLGAGVVAWLLGLMSVASFNVWSGVYPLEGFPAFAGKTFYDLVDYATANVMMPLGGMLIALFAGWRMPRSSLLDALGLSDTDGFRAWLFLCRYVAPLAILAIFIANLA